MGQSIIVELSSKAMSMVLLLSLPSILLATFVGLGVSLLQALTQVQEAGCGPPYGVVELREHLLLLLIYYRTYTTHLFLAQIFHMDEATICRAIM